MENEQQILEVLPNKIRDNIAAATTLAEYKQWQVIYLSTCYRVDNAFISRVTGCDTVDIRHIMNSYRRPFTEMKRADVGKQFGSVSLNERQLQLLRWIAFGKTSQEMADMLGISVRTVEHHRKNLYKKMNVNGVAELVAFAVLYNIIT